MPPAAVLDACTLYPVGLRDTLLSIAQAHVFRPLWSADILAEVRAAVLRSVPGVDEARLDRMLADMHTAFPDALVSGYTPLIPKMTNDRPDRHVLAAAVAGGADVIVTWNVRHFPESACRPFRVAVETPDDFLTKLHNSDPDAVEVALAKQVSRYAAPAMTVE